MGWRWRVDIPVDLGRACLEYGIYLPKDFSFQRGGKLPGLFGGHPIAGGRRSDGHNGFSLRLMWRSGGQGEVYAYVPKHPPGRGLSIERGAWRFERGRWTRISQEVVLNTPGKANGRLRIRIDGRLVVDRGGLTFRRRPGLGVSGVMADVFYGGRTESWAAPRDTFVRVTPFTLRW